ncbi:acyl-CoA thioesterase [Aureimonas endophytica]|uniref:Acyl-CoA thioesterase n=1 Tax=Aureimonas endophytica TaxID=2027858 RepID=A0A916ZYV9_9HYPH|nr:acyl-CoA thioesterase [Aureimonas endophytica]GGE19003.1 acyl-CoA thioesterase [Aureimonas endophytica]
MTDEMGPSEPIGELTMRLQALPADANADGDVFGGWVVAQMDLAAAVRANERAGGRVATVAINALAFKKPVKIGDVLAVYTTIERVGRSSITLMVEAWAQRHLTRNLVKVTEGSFVMVALDADGKSREVPAG